MILLVVLVYTYLSYSYVASIYRVLTVCSLYHLDCRSLPYVFLWDTPSRSMYCCCRLCFFVYGRERITLSVTSQMLTCEILSSMHHVKIKITSSASNTLVPDLLPLPSTNVTYVHARVANLLGSFYELSTLTPIYTGWTAAYYTAPCRTAVSFTYNYWLMYRIVCMI